MEDAALAVVRAFERFTAAPNPIMAAYELAALNDAMSDLKSWMPNYNPKTGEVEDG